MLARNFAAGKTCFLCWAFRCRSVAPPCLWCHWCEPPSRSRIFPSAFIVNLIKFLSFPKGRSFLRSSRLRTLCKGFWRSLVLVSFRLPWATAKAKSGLRYFWLEQHWSFCSSSSTSAAWLPFRTSGGPPSLRVCSVQTLFSPGNLSSFAGPLSYRRFSRWQCWCSSWSTSWGRQLPAPRFFGLTASSFLPCECSDACLFAHDCLPAHSIFCLHLLFPPLNAHRSRWQLFHGTG